MGIVSEARDALLYGQLHEGLKYDLIKAPGVSGYNSLHLAAKNEERRLQELKKRQRYSKADHGQIPFSYGKPRDNKGSTPAARVGSNKRLKCYICV